MIRNVAVIGALHHGKTLLCDMLLESTFIERSKITNTTVDPKYTDCRLDEIDR